MPEWVLIAFGLVAGLLVVGGVVTLAFRPRRRDARRWLAPPSGEIDEPTKHWPGGPTVEP